MEHKEIINELKQGICEITWMDSFSVENSIIGTLSMNHLNDDFPNPYEYAKNIVAVWNVNNEDWVEIPTINIVEVERLTGIGVKDDVDKVNIDQMEEFLYDEYYKGGEKPQWM